MFIYYLFFTNKYHLPKNLLTFTLHSTPTHTHTLPSHFITNSTFTIYLQTLIFVYGVLFAFTFLSQALYFNPLFLLFGFEFYNIKTMSGAGIFLISRNGYKTPSDIVIDRAYRINNYTFIERG